MVSVFIGCDSDNSSSPEIHDAWTWVSGSDNVDQAGVYGIKGTADAANIPGARLVSVSWSDADGNLWLFGGCGVDSVDGKGYLNDLWKYNTSTNQWTWVSGSNIINQAGEYGEKGTAGAANFPGARASDVSWSDANGNLWLFGGEINNNYFNDLWKYDTVSGMWTWVSGSNSNNQVGVYGEKGIAAATNFPGARKDAVSWTDADGNLWLFGGYGWVNVAENVDERHYLNELWKYNPIENQWTWVSGSDIFNQAGVYGEKGTPDAANMPGVRDCSVSWTDADGNFWLFGGHGFDSENNLGDLNDLWKYNPIENQWTWVSGSDTRYQAGVYGEKGTADDSNMPGARSGNVSWTDADGNLWLFGGEGRGIDSEGYGYLSDLWKYNPIENQWTWVSGPETVDQIGVYGTKGKAAYSNIPGARGFSVSWADTDGNLWLFGGYYEDNDENMFVLNDLWKFNML